MKRISKRNADCESLLWMSKSRNSLAWDKHIKHHHSLMLIKWESFYEERKRHILDGAVKAAKNSRIIAAFNRDFGAETNIWNWIRIESIM